MAFDPMPSGGSGPHGPWCMSCRQPINPEQHSIQIHFETNEHKELSGQYHEECGRPFQSIARALNALNRLSS